jgi:DNA-binding cell septation regulator SpoVG
MIASEITVDLRLSGKNGSKPRWHADVTIPLGLDGAVKISGFSVFVTDAGKLWVAPPSRKGEKRWFDVVTLMGKIRTLIEAAVLAEYERLVGSTSDAET